MLCLNKFILITVYTYVNRLGTGLHVIEARTDTFDSLISRLFYLTFFQGFVCRQVFKKIQNLHTCMYRTCIIVKVNQQQISIQFSSDSIKIRHQILVRCMMKICTFKTIDLFYSIQGQFPRGRTVLYWHTPVCDVITV